MPNSEDGCRIGEQVRRFAVAVRDASPDLSGDHASLKLVLAFFIPGPLSEVNWTGVRRGGLSRKHRSLQFNVAVPEDLQADEVVGFACASFREAVDLSRTFLGQKGLNLNDSLPTMLADIERRTREPWVPRAHETPLDAETPSS